MIRVVGRDGNVPAEGTPELAAAERNRQLFRLPRFDGTVGPTVETGASPTPRFDFQVGGALVANVEGECELLVPPPDRIETRNRLVAHPLGVGVHLKT